jgi:hypothetical protein
MLEPLEQHSSFFTRRMFGGLAVYVFGRQMMVLVQPTKTGRWTWHGVLVCTGHAHHPALLAEFPALAAHDVLKKWLYIDSSHESFEHTMVRVVGRIARNDERFGIHPRLKRLAEKPRRRGRAPGAQGRRRRRAKGSAR